MTIENINNLEVHSFTFIDYEGGADGLYDWFTSEGIIPKEIRIQSTLDADSPNDWIYVSCEPELFSSSLKRILHEHPKCLTNRDAYDIEHRYILILPV